MTIFATDGTPYPEAMQRAVLMRAERMTANAQRGRVAYLATLDGKSRAHRVVKDKIGDPLAIHRDISLYVHPSRYDLPAVRAAKGCGRPPGRPTLQRCTVARLAAE